MCAALDTAFRELRRGRQPIPLPFRKKKPTLDAWQDLILTESDLPRYFNGRPQNIGILNGAPSNGQVDIDLDWASARRLALLFLPPTGSRFGRASAPESHWVYVADPLEPTKTYDDPTGKHGGERARIAEYRSTGTQTVWPGSVHEGGEPIEWAEDGEPAVVDGRVLKEAMNKLAGAALLARHWPAEGSRHDAALALAGGLLRAAWPTEDAAAFIESVAAAAGDDEVTDRVRAVATTDRAMRERRKTTGWKTLAEFVDSRVVGRVREWLGVPSAWSEESFAGTATAQTARVEQPWPELNPAARHGLAGEIVAAIDPHTEADPVATLGTFLVMFGSAVGRGPHYMVGEDRHGLNEYLALVGETSKARKGSSRSGPLRLLDYADPVWARDRVQGGLSSGEGLLAAIADPIYRTNKKGEEECVFEGSEDKRLLCIEEELSQLLKVAGRQGNIISEIVRRGWDSRESLRTMTKASPLTVTGPHISIVGHITADELRRELDDTARANGFGNRFLWLCVRRSKAEPFLDPLPHSVAAELGRRVQRALAFARRTARVAMDDEAKAMWCEVYPDLSAGKPGLVGALTARVEAHALRLALAYALLDCSPTIAGDHLVAALAFIDYCEASARRSFGDATGDPIADRILAALRANGPMDQTAISDLFGRHVRSGQLGQALETLVAAGRVRSVREETGGRPRIVWAASP